MSMKWLKTGAAAQAASVHAEQEAEAKAQVAKATKAGDDGAFLYKYRYWMKNDSENEITFLDGDLNENGILSEVCYDEHALKIGNDYNNFFPCTADEEPCPLCAGNAKKSFVAVFTVIDHSKWVDKEGNQRQNEKRLFVAKMDTIKYLRKQAIKRGGLTGCRFEVSRTGDKSAAVGNNFEFESKYTPLEVAAEYGVDASPLVYEDIIQYKSASELLSLGLGISTGGIGSESAPASGTTPDLSNDL